jgi:hypothetical protein
VIGAIACGSSSDGIIGSSASTPGAKRSIVAPSGSARRGERRNHVVPRVNQATGLD